MGQPRPVSRRKAPVRLAIRSGTCCLYASTASTANSGSVCSHARIASANPCAMKNCDDSAAQAIISAEIRMAGAAHSTVAGLVARIVSVAAKRNRPPEHRPRIILFASDHTRAADRTIGIRTLSAGQGQTHGTPVAPEIALARRREEMVKSVDEGFGELAREI